MGWRGKLWLSIGTQNNDSKAKANTEQPAQLTQLQQWCCARTKQEYYFHSANRGFSTFELRNLDLPMHYTAELDLSANAHHPGLTKIDQQTAFCLCIQGDHYKVAV
jgi:hypothetical protein